MKRIPGILFLSGLILVVILVISNLSGNNNDYARTIEKQRKDKDRYMKNDPDSPFVRSGIQFNGLSYFPPDPGFKFSAEFIPLPSMETFRMEMSDGTFDMYIKYASIEFELGGKHQKLTLFMPSGSKNRDELFLPFFDETSAISTYGGGRYLNPVYKGGRNIDLDFNLAYNPYCAYTEGYSCPLPPAENRIEAEVTAGEKKYKPE